MTNSELVTLATENESLRTLCQQSAWKAAAAEAVRIAPQVSRPLLNREVKRIAVLGGYYGAIVLAAEKTTTPDTVRALCISVQAWVDDADGTTDFTRAEVQAMLGGLVTAGLMTSTQRTSLENAAKVPVDVTPAQIRDAWMNRE